MQVDTAVAEPVAPVQEQPEPAPLSITEHAAIHGPAPKDETPEQAEERIQKAHHSAQQRRERESGKFAEGKVRHRAESQKARAEDVPRIRELTGKLRAAEEELTRLRATHAAPATIAKAEERVETAAAKVEAPAPVAPPAARSATGGAFREPEPQEDDPKFAGDYAKYLRAAAAWEGRKAYHDEKQAERQHAEREQFTKTSEERLKAAQAKYADFDAVADRVLARIPPRSVVDQYVFTRQAGNDVLYHFDSHPQELDAILQMGNGVDQFEALTLLAQRLASPTASAAGSTTAAPARNNPIVLPPKPATVVRTEAQRASGSPPPTDGSLSIAEHAKAFGPKRR